MTRETDTVVWLCKRLARTSILKKVLELELKTTWFNQLLEDDKKKLLVINKKEGL